MKLQCNKKREHRAQERERVRQQEEWGGKVGKGCAHSLTSKTHKMRFCVDSTASLFPNCCRMARSISFTPIDAHTHTHTHFEVCVYVCVCLWGRDAVRDTRGKFMSADHF